MPIPWLIIWTLLLSALIWQSGKALIRRRGRRVVSDLCHEKLHIEQIVLHRHLTVIGNSLRLCMINHDPETKELVASWTEEEIASSELCSHGDDGTVHLVKAAEGCYVDAQEEMNGQD